MTDRELDAEVAEKIMRWTWWNFMGGESFLVPDYIADHFANHPAIGWRAGKLESVVLFADLFPMDYGHVKLPRFATEIGSAMEVVEKMRQCGFGILICDAAGGWDVEMDKDELTVADVTAETLPKAICLAALAAKEKEPTYVRSENLNA